MLGFGLAPTFQGFTCTQSEGPSRSDGGSGANPLDVGARKM